VVSIACYRPKRGKKRALEQLMREHVKTLRRESLATRRTPIIVRAKDGTVLEIFEWKSNKAIDKAHSNRAVLAMWERFKDACDYVKVGDVAESRDRWASFAPLDL
jgi:quinol monooxygenase YgiN